MEEERARVMERIQEGDVAYNVNHTLQRESALLTTFWSESTLSSRCFGGPASRLEGDVAKDVNHTPNPNP